MLLHSGVGLIMVNELFVARFAAEYQVSLQEGQTTDYMRDIRTTELAFIDRSGDKTDEHIVIPASRLAGQRRRERGSRRQRRTARTAG